jgi:putative acetyltransferase
MLPLNLLIRKELPADVAAISRVTEMAFREHPHSSHTEQFIIDELRRTGALSISLVAEREGRVVGHIAFDFSRGGEGGTGGRAHCLFAGRDL